MIIPALDFYNKKIVRLYQGNYDKIKYYDYNIIDKLLEYKIQGAKNIHLVDLNGARASKNKQLIFLKEIISSVKDLIIQIGGGIRSENYIEKLFKFGAKRIVIGSLAITNKSLVKNFLTMYGSEKIILALDINIINNKNKICIHGWEYSTDILLEDILQYYISYGLKYILCTDISKDGTLLGPNINLYKEIIRKFPNIHIQASGGVGFLSDIVELKDVGVQDIIIGKAFLENQFTFSEANLC